MKEKITTMIGSALVPLGLFVSDVYYSKEEDVATLNIELDSEKVIDIELITEATKIINPLIEKEVSKEEIAVVDIHSRSKGDEQSE